MSAYRGDFDSWYRQHHRRLVAALSFTFGDPELAAEAADEAVVRAYERWNRVAVMDSPRGWLYRVGFNQARRRLRRRSTEQLLLRRQAADRSVDPLAVAPGHRELWALVQQLPPRQRQAVALRHLGQFTEAEIAQVMGITRGTVSATLRAAYRTLRVELAVDAPPPVPDPTTEVRS